MICVYEVLVYCIVSPQSIYFSCSYYASGMILSQCVLFATNELLGVGHIYVVVHHVFTFRPIAFSIHWRSPNSSHNISKKKIVPTVPQVTFS